MTLPAIALSALLLLAVAIANGGPIHYPDTIAYLIDGERIAHLQAPYAVRPVFYGVAAWLLHRKSWFGPALYVQAFIVAHLLWLTLRSVGARPRAGGFLASILALVLLTPVAWVVAHLLPDIFVAVLVLSLFLLGFCADGLGRGERAYLVLLSAACVGFHLTAPPVAVAVLGCAAASRWWGMREARPVSAGLPIALGLAGALSFNALVWHQVTLTPNSPPALLARVLADGPGRAFLDAQCPTVAFELCRYRDRLPATEDGFLWGMLPSLPAEDGKRIKAEAGAVVRGTVAMFPADVAAHMVLNAVRQLGTFQSETQFSPDEAASLQRDGSDLAQAGRDTLQARGWFERPHLDAVNAVHAVVAGLSLAAALVLLGRCWRAGLRRAAALLATVLVALPVNAFVTGALGGVFARYEARVIWLLPFAVLAAGQALWRVRPRGGS